jgi:hypothetical protein
LLTKVVVGLRSSCGFIPALHLLVLYLYVSEEFEICGEEFEFLAGFGVDVLGEVSTSYFTDILGEIGDRKRRRR